MVSLFSHPNLDLMKASSNTLYACRYDGDKALHVVDAKSILSVVAMPPLPLKQEELDGLDADEKFKNLFYVGELIGQDIMHCAGVDEPMGGDEDSGEGG
jgi:hypothetical protein